MTDTSPYRPCIAYNAKSSPDEKDSTASQLAAIEQKVAAECGGRTIVASYKDTDASGYKTKRADGLRGDGLAAARTHAERLVAEHGEAELWVFNSDRLARGDGKDASHLVEHLLWALKAGVTLRSVTDDMSVRDIAYAAMRGQQTHGDSHGKAEHVKRGKDTQRALGRYMGGPAPDGYMQDRRPAGINAETGEPMTKPHGPRLLDPDRVPIIERAFALAFDNGSERGKGDTYVRDRLNLDGYRRKSGKPWDRRTVQSMLTNPHYAAQTADGKPMEQLDGSPVPAIVSADVFRKVQAQRAVRDQSADGRKRAKRSGGPATVRFALSKLGKCARCGGTMYCRPDPYKRKDGTQARWYVCQNSRTYCGPAAECDAPRIDAEACEPPFLKHLEGYCVNFEAWMERATDAQTADVRALEAQAQTVRDMLAKHSRAKHKAEDKLADALASDSDLADTYAKAAKRAAQEVAQAEAALAEIEAAVSEADSQNTADAMFDLWSDLSASLRGRLTGSNSMAEVNAELRSVLSEVVMDTRPDGSSYLLAVFAERGTSEPAVTREWEEWDMEGPEPPMFAEGSATFLPDTVEILAPGRALPAPVALPVQTGQDSQA